MRPFDTTGRFPLFRAPRTAFSPGYLNPTLWLDASSRVFSGVSLTAAVHGDPVQTWHDMSANRNHATQATLAKRPTFRDVAGVKAVRFDGTDDVMAFTNAINFGVNRTVFAVGQLHDETGVAARILFANSGSGNWYVGITGASDQSFSSYLNTALVQETDTGTLSPFSTSRKVATYRWSTSGANVAALHRVNETVSYNATDADGHSDPASGIFVVGGFDATPSIPIPIDLNELIVYDKALSDSEQAIVRSYLYAKWRIVV